jgi:hypothetical protein
MKIFRSIIVLLFAVILYSCEAPRLNPLDPNNPDYQLTAINGSLKAAASANAIVGAKVTWRNENISATTNQNGSFSFTGLVRKNGYIIFEAGGYYKDSVLVQFTESQYNLGDHSMNAIPQMSSLWLYTKVENKYAFDPDTYLIVQTKVTDAESDIDTVYLRCTAISFYKKLTYNSSTLKYEGTFLPSDFSTGSIDVAVGQNFEIVVKSKNRTIADAVGSSVVKRLIKQEVIPYNPSNKETVGSSPALLWQRFLPNFNFTYTLEIYTDVPDKQLKWQKEMVSSNNIQIVPDVTLPSGEYFWVIWCVDDYKNSTRSKPASFIVQ